MSLKIEQFFQGQQVRQNFQFILRRLKTNLSRFNFGLKRRYSAECYVDQESEIPEEMGWSALQARHRLQNMIVFEDAFVKDFEPSFFLFRRNLRQQGKWVASFNSKKACFIIQNSTYRPVGKGGARDAYAPPPPHGPKKVRICGFNKTMKKPDRNIWCYCKPKRPKKRS